MKHLILNLSDGDRERAALLLRSKTWMLEGSEGHCSALAPGDLVLIHVEKPRCQFIGRAVLATAFLGRTPSASGAGADGGPRVLLADVEEWSSPVSLKAAVHRIDPTASNPQVQSNARGFRSGIVLITAGEYSAVVALSREAAAQP